MNINFRNDVTSNYMIIEDIEKFSTDNFGVKILLNNRIKGILPFDYENVNDRTCLIYDISSKQSLDDFRKNGKITFEGYKNLIFSLYQTINNIREYLLDTGGLMLRKDCIFIDARNGNIDFCYNPCYKGMIADEIRDLLSELLSLIDYSDPKTVRIAYDAQKVTVSERYTMEDIIGIVSETISVIDAKEKITEEKTCDVKNSKPKITQVNMPCNGETAYLRNVKMTPLWELEKEQPKSEATFLEKAQIYFKDREAGEIFDDINELKIIKKIKNINADNLYKSDKKMSKNKQNCTEEKSDPDLPQGIGEMTEDLEKSNFFGDYRMV